MYRDSLARPIDLVMSRWGILACICAVSEQPFSLAAAFEVHIANGKLC